MVEDMFRKTSKKTWYKWSFYLNIVLFFVVAIFLYLVVYDVYNAGVADGSSDGFSQGISYASWMFAFARDVAILGVALAIIFVQLIRNISTIIRRSL